MKREAKASRFYGAEPPACIRQIPLAIESGTGPQAICSSILYPFFRSVKQFALLYFYWTAVHREGRAGGGRLFRERG